MAATTRKLRLIEGGVSGSPDGADQGPRVRVAIASRDGKALDAHFGFAERLLVYEVTRRAHRLTQVVTCAPEDAAPEPFESEDRISAKVAALAGCHLLFVLAIGPPAAAKVIRANIYPIKVDAPEGIPHVISRVQTMIRGNPPAWLRKALTENQRHA
jgi:nitrogen fixation protein NifX